MVSFSVDAVKAMPPIVERVYENKESDDELEQVSSLAPRSNDIADVFLVANQPGLSTQYMQ